MIRTIATLAATVALLAVSPSPLLAQAPTAPPTQEQINEQILAELKAIHQLLERLVPPPPAPAQGVPPATARLTNLTGYVLGRADAPVTMVEFTDLQCPFCRQYAATTFADIKKNWIDTGKLRYISRDVPLDVHPEAMPSARAARCAGEQGKFWDMRESLMRNANLLTAEFISRTAAGMQLDMTAFSACTASTRFDAAIEADYLEAEKIGLQGTPTFVIGRTTATTLEGAMIVGALPYAAFDARLRAALEAAKQ